MAEEAVVKGAAALPVVIAQDNSEAIDTVERSRCPGITTEGRCPGITTEGVNPTMLSVADAIERVEIEKEMSLINAWEESEKTKAQNKADQELSSVSSWEDTKMAALEAEFKKIEEDLEKKKAQCAEKKKKKMAITHKAAEEKRAMIEVMRGERVLKAEKVAAKYRAKLNRNLSMQHPLEG